MNDTEDRLKAQHLAAPSRHLDRRIENLLIESAIKKQRSRRVPAWLAVAACAACLAVGFAAGGLGGDREAPVQEVVYIVQEGHGRGNVFDVPARSWAPQTEKRWGRAYVIEFQDDPESVQPATEGSPT